MRSETLDKLIDQTKKLLNDLQWERACMQSTQDNQEKVEPERPMPPPELSGADEGIFQLGAPTSKTKSDDDADEFNMDDLDQHFIAAKFEPEKVRKPTQVKLVPEEEDSEGDENVAAEVLACVEKINANYGSTKEEIHDFLMKNGSKIKSYKIMRTIRALDKEKRLSVVNKKPKTYKVYPQRNNVVRLNKA